MTKNPAFVRKVIYLCCIAGLLIPISWISRPATSDRGDGNYDRGGALSQLRTEHGLSQADLGEIDPASSTMQLATLGLRGPAATILWTQALEHQKREEWDSLSATLNQIAKLQPHLIRVWTFQAWNIAYNVSVEFDDYRMRYHWVKKGVDFMLKGTKYNADSPKLLNELGWFFHHKLGRSDESRQYRHEFRIDKEFHATLPFDNNEWNDVYRLSPYEEQPDNFLVAWLWHLRMEEAASLDDNKKLGASPLVFYSRAPMDLMYFSIAIEGEGILDEVAQESWREAGKAWYAYGDRNTLTTLGDIIQLNNLENLDREISELKARLAALAPGVAEQLETERFDALTEEQQQAYNTSEEARTAEQYELAAQATQVLESISPRDIALRAPADTRDEALLVADQLEQKEVEHRYTKRYREQINYPYWLTRSEIEQSDEAIEARLYLYEAEGHFREARLDDALAAYELAWERWAGIFEKHPEMLEDTTAEDLMDAITRYARLLGQHDLSFPPDDFPLMKLLEVQDPNYAPPPGETAAAAESEAPSQESSSEPNESEAATPTDESPTAPQDSADSEEDTPPAEPVGESSAESATEPEPATEEVPPPAAESSS